MKLKTLFIIASILVSSCSKGDDVRPVSEREVRKEKRVTGTYHCRHN